MKRQETDGGSGQGYLMYQSKLARKILERAHHLPSAFERGDSRESVKLASGWPFIFEGGFVRETLRWTPIAGQRFGVV